MKLLFIVVLIAISLIACAAAPKGQWMKADERAFYSDEQFKADQFDCEYKSNQMSQMERNEIIRAISTDQNFKRCMGSKGYHWVQAP